MVEGALTLFAFISLFMSTLDIAQVLFVHQSLVERVRYAARNAAVSCCSVDAVTNLVVYGTTTAPGNGGAGYWGLTPSNVAVTFADQNTANQRVTIRVSGLDYKTYSPFMVGSFKNIPVQVSIPLELP
jgi:hypothetical protein